MYFVLSPAKSLNETDDVPINISHYYSQPALIQQSQAIMNILKDKEPMDLQELMGISDSLAQLNAQRHQGWAWSESKPFTDNNAKPACYLFNGGVYTGLDIYNMDKAAVAYVNERLGILSGLYGLIKPLDLIQPYRLEMGVKLKNERGNSLYEFWEGHIAAHINERMQEVSEMSGEKVLVNLASNEYFKSVNKKILEAPVITPRFEDEKNGTFKVISFYAKKARGLMVKYAADNKLTKAEDLKQFDLAGYSYVDEASDDKTWMFRRAEVDS